MLFFSRTKKRGPYQEKHESNRQGATKPQESGICNRSENNEVNVAVEKSMEVRKTKEKRSGFLEKLRYMAQIERSAPRGGKK